MLACQMHRSSSSRYSMTPTSLCWPTWLRRFNTRCRSSETRIPSRNRTSENPLKLSSVSEAWQKVLISQTGEPLWIINRNIFKRRGYFIELQEVFVLQMRLHEIRSPPFM